MTSNSTSFTSNHHHDTSAAATTKKAGAGGATNAHMTSTMTSAATSGRRSGKYVACKVLMLDDSELVFQVPPKCTGCILLREVFKKLQVVETDYFDLEYTNEVGQVRYVDPEKTVLKQCAHKKEPIFKFVVKFYSPDPGLLEAEYTRYLFALQVKRDLASGAMPCQEHTAVLLASYVVQAEFGDYCVEQCDGQEYLSEVRLLPEQTKDIESKIMEHHIEHRGQTPAEADFNLLDTARKVELYGLRMHNAKDHDNVALHLSVAHLGILVFQNYTKINTFSWAKIRKLSFKRKRFLIKLQPEGYGYYKDTVEFYFDTRDECKNFWKKCIEHHSFFRCRVSDTRRPRSTSRHRVISRGSSFRYSGRTQKQLVEYVREQSQTNTSFERSVSMRTVSTCRSAGATPRTGTLNSRRGLSSADSHASCPGVSTTTSSGGGAGDRSTMSPSVSSGSHTLLSTRGAVDTEDDDDDDEDGRDGVGTEGNRRRGRRRGNATGQGDNQRSQLTTSKSTNAVLERTEHVSRPLTRQPDKQSSPNFNDNRSVEDDLKPYLERSAEIENIPQECYNRRNKNSILKKDTKSIPSPPPSPTYNTTDDDIDGRRNVVRTPGTTEEDIPPPPPPIYRDSAPSDAPPPSHASHTTPRSTKTASILSSLESSTTADAKSAAFNDSRDDLTKKKIPNGSAYYICKELLMTERTYRKELELLCVLFRTAMNSSEASTAASQLDQLMFKNLDPVYRHHVSLLKDLEHRMAIWEGKLTSNIIGDHQKIGDILFSSLPTVIKHYNAYMINHSDILLEIETLLKKSRTFEKMYTEFELKKHCYLPLISFLQRPAQRMAHYCHILDKLMNVYGPSNVNYTDCEACYRTLVEAMQPHNNRINLLENMHKLIELQRDLVGIDTIQLPNRKFIREGCLQKLSRRGFQQRMFLLFNDTFLYMSRTASSHLQFKVHGQLSTLNMKLDNINEGDSTYGVPNAFNVISGNKTLKLAASNVEEKDKWLEDLEEAIRFNNDNHLQNNMYSTIKSNGSTDTLDDTLDTSVEPPLTPSNPSLCSPSGGGTAYRVNTTMHVCWHRNTSVCLKDISRAGQNHFSGYVLRKFKNSNGWQKLWVIFTNFCLFFYKTFQDEFPLASLPLLGYAITTPNDSDNINKDFVFKLQFKNHVYYFRAESQYTFDRWMSVISSATSTSRRVRAFSRFESATSQ